MTMARLIAFSLLTFLFFIPSLGARETPFSVGGYYPSHETALRQLPPDRIDFNLYDVVYQAFLRFNKDGSLKPDPKLDSKPLLEAARAAGKSLVMLSVGGGRFGLFPELCGTPEKADVMARKMVGYAVENGYDGIDLDWEGDMNAENGRRFGMLIRALRSRLDSVAASNHRRYYFSVTLMGGEWFLRHLEPASLAVPDWINLMSYDMNYRVAAYHAPLQSENGPSIEKVLDYLTGTLKIPKNKINVGLPFYGFLYENLKQGGEVKNGRTESGRSMLTFVRIQEKGNGFTRSFDPLTRGAKLTSDKPDTYILYDDAESIASKVKWVREQGYRGVFVWSINQDCLPDGGAPLTAALKQSSGR